MSIKMAEEMNCINTTRWSDDNISDSIVSELFSDTYKTVAGSCIFFFVFPFVLFHFRFFPLRATCVVILGAALMIMFNVVSQEDAYEVIGARNNLMTIFLVIGMMLLGEYVEREQLLARVLRRVLPPGLSYPAFLLRSCGLSFLLAAFFTGDGACIMLTPMLLKCWKEHERARWEIETLLLGLSTSANIGAASMFFGGVAPALITSKTHLSAFHRSRLNLRTCFWYLLPPAFTCFWINYAFLLAYYKIRLWRITGCQVCEQHQPEREPFGASLGVGVTGVSQRGNGFLKADQEELFYDSFVFREERLAHPPTLETIIEDEILELPESTTWVSELDITSHGSGTIEVESGDVNGDGISRLRPCLASEDLTSLDIELSSQSQYSSPTSQPDPVTSINSVHLYDSSLPFSGSRASLSGISTAEFFGLRLQAFDQESVRGSIILQAMLVIVLVVTLVLLLASGSSVYFDPGLVPFGGALIVILVDTLVNRSASTFILRRIDWSIFVVFSAIFIWMAGFNSTGVPHWVWYKLGFYQSSWTDIASVVVLAVTITLMTNTFGPVPVTIMVLDQLEPCADQLRLVLYLAWIVMISGNLTPFGSVANAIVTSKSSALLNYPLTFSGFLSYGVPSTVILMTCGLVIISLLLTFG